MKNLTDFINSFDKMDELSKEVTKTERVMNIIIIAMAILVFLSGGELIVSLVIMISLNRASKVMFCGKMPYYARWSKLFLVTMKCMVVIMLVAFILESLYPPLHGIFYYKLG